MPVGTPAYLSPEQARGDDSLDIRSDIYALGATLYRLLSGRLLYDAPDAMEVAYAHIYFATPLWAQKVE